ncbi:NADH:ubiquinone oxidoreductase complex i intermediate-associated protein 30 [Tateyamaria omphalii]|uniref:NADH:ubiquinone oxidoreductase complex i intermediate-associated protein 30 n=1 Tax=Tateyamaria omphalii TaxID=299262 RepID=A0A1P8N023_9RHOB|nr:CIA30 family protein [Tateyamaria omphalii]APX13661.1 NADH:ubiquinone oxidoreductase complex i intermediate-associated protein 30 [Tateyamaria omphalii]
MELNPDWEYVADTVMGGVSSGQASVETVEGREAVRLTGTVSLENNGGFVQIAFDLAGGDVFDASDFTGVALDVLGNGESYDLRLRTDALTRPWQSFRSEFVAPEVWTTIGVPFTAFEAHRTEAAFDPSRLRRVGILAIGREMQADIAVSGVRFYR